MSTVSGAARRASAHAAADRGLGAALLGPGAAGGCAGGWLTSMRTALILLFLLAVAAIPARCCRSATSTRAGHRLLPGAPDAGADPGPALASSTSTPRPGSRRSTCCCSSRWSAAWCPGCEVHCQALLRAAAGRAARLDRLPRLGHRPTPAADRDGGARSLRAPAVPHRGARAADGSVTVSAEKGYLKETGNLFFHFALLALLVGVALGSWYGWHGDRLLVAGADRASATPCSSTTSTASGARVTPADLPPFCVRLDEFTANYPTTGSRSRSRDAV